MTHYSAWTAEILKGDISWNITRKQLEIEQITRFYHPLQIVNYSVYTDTYTMGKIACKWAYM